MRTKIKALVNTFAASSGTNIGPLLFTAVAIGLLFFFMIVRPQKKNLARHKELVNSLSSGTEVITSGGIYGTIRAVDEDTVDLEISPGTTIKVAKRSIAMKKVKPEELETRENS